MRSARTERNARILLDLTGQTDIPVFAGCSRPVLRPLRTAEQVHGRTGIAGIEDCDPSGPLQEKRAVDVLIEHLGQPEAFFWPLVVASSPDYVLIQVAIVRYANFEQMDSGGMFAIASIADRLRPDPVPPASALVHSHDRLQRPQRLNMCEADD